MRPIVVLKSFFGASLIVSLFLCSCAHSDNHALSFHLMGNDTLYICDMQSVPEVKKTICLSELIDSFRIVRFENTDTALFKTWKVYITDRHIGVLNATSPFKLFDHEGTYLCDVGAIGQAEGEYTMLYSGAINEEDSAVWLAPFSGNRLWKYNMKGKCIASFGVREMHKPVIRCEKDGSLTVTNLYFRGMPGFLYLRLLPNDSIYYSIAEKQHSVSPRDKEGNFMGYNHEVWFENNVEAFTYRVSYSDTLYRYDMRQDHTIPRLTVCPKAQDGYYEFCEMPSYFLITLRQGNKIKQTMANKADGLSVHVNVRNDFMGNLPVEYFHAVNGWYYQMFEPIELMELIEQTLSDKKLNEKDKDKLNALLSGIQENDNNILFMGKIRSTVKF